MNHLKRNPRTGKDSENAVVHRVCPTRRGRAVAERALEPDNPAKCERFLCPACHRVCHQHKKGAVITGAV